MDRPDREKIATYEKICLSFCIRNSDKAQVAGIFKEILALLPEPIDSPKLREKINQILHQYIIRNLYETTIISEGLVTDQILAICEEEIGKHYSPDCPQCYENLLESGVIKQAKREERKRIMRELGNYAFAEAQHIPQSGREPVIICLTEADLQALRGEE
ncbi:hypothetical protein LCGC14_0350150 [marine sediment metagenome]|uniref:Uncharacterized protein n=1 Tax=marine sediment metagenome TaxID=412755 RepID=A0A0F9WJ67_9ZZZZ